MLSAECLAQRQFLTQKWLFQGGTQALPVPLSELSPLLSCLFSGVRKTFELLFLLESFPEEFKLKM